MMKVFSKFEINEKLNKTNEWIFDGISIGKEFLFKDFKSAVSFVNKVASVAEKMDHHPDIFLHSWNKVKITISTHSANGITENDFILAEKIEELNK
jgi:4a-hydroxytetrahydrobiopterin dehydratase